MSNNSTPWWVQNIYGRLALFKSGANVPAQPNLNFEGDGVTVTPDPANRANKVTIAGASTISKLVDAASPALTQGYGVMQKNGKLTLAQESALGTSLYIAGLVLAAANPNSSAQLITHGPIDPTVFNVGAGVACAVGFDASAKPVRVTDPTCVTKLKYVGTCDASGAIYVSPYNAENFNVRDFGALGDGVADDIVAITAACTAAGNFGGANVVFPPGSYLVSTPIGPLAKGVSLKGYGGDIYAETGTVILYSGATGDAVRVCSDSTTNQARMSNISDLLVKLTNASNTTGAAFGAMGGGYVNFARCVAIGPWKYGLVLDGTEQCFLDSCSFWNDNAAHTSIGVWLVEGAARGQGWTVAGSTNVIKIDRCNFNGPQWGIYEQGGTNHIITNCEHNVAFSGGFARVNGLCTIFDNCYSEGVGTAHYQIEGGTNVAIRAAVMSSSDETYGVNIIGAVYNLSLDNNLFSCGGIKGQALLAGHHHSVGNYFSHAGRLYIDGGGGSVDSALVANIEVNGTEPRSIAGTTLEPTANWDVGLSILSSTSGRPATQVSSGGGQYTIKQGYWDSLTRWRDRRRVRSGATGNQDAASDDGIEWGTTTAAGSNVVLCPSPVAQNTAGLAKITISARLSADGTKTGAWIICQRYYRTTGDVTLLGTPTTVYSDADVAFTAPTLTVDTGTETVRATCPAIASDAIFWYARVELDAVCT